MKVVNLSLDPHLLDPESVAAVRARAYGKITDRYITVVPTPGKLHTVLSDTVSVYGSEGVNKIVRLVHIYSLLKSILEKEKMDVITVQDPYFLGVLAVYMAKRYHTGLEVHILGLEKLSWLRLQLAKFTFKRVGAVRVNSKHLYERMNDEFGVPFEKITYAPIYVDVDKIGLGVRTFNPEERRLYDEKTKEFEEQFGSFLNFITVSRLVPVKRISLQLQAMEELIKTHNMIRLHIVGDGPEKETLRQEIKDRGLGEYVIMHGAKYGPELGVYYISADCFLLTSESEGWGMVITEAATAGLPIIMTNVGCAGEFIRDGESGIILPVTDTLRPLVSAMDRIIREPELRNTLVEGAFKGLQALPDLQTILELYKKSWEKAAVSAL